jgi:isocitrate/isopropylmalate dehydrogenase
LIEGEYAALEHESVKGVVECLKVVTAVKSKRIAKFAFDFATRNGRKKVRFIRKHRRLPLIKTIHDNVERLVKF